jgi:hypothetical protein
MGLFTPAIYSRDEEGTSMGWRVKRANRPTVSPEAQFRRSRLGSHLSEQNRTIALAAVFAHCGHFDEALAMLETLRKKRPLDPQIRLAIMNAKQLSGDFSPEQWCDPRIVWRAQADAPQAPLWNGQPMPGETLLIWDIDTSPRKHMGPRRFGLGDIVQLSRMLAPVKPQSQAAQLIFQVPATLAPIMRTLKDPDLIVDRVPESSAFDRHFPLILTPSLVPLTDEIFASVPYLHASPEAIARWAPTFADRRYTHIGIHFAADARHRSAQKRSIPLKLLAPLFSVERTKWYSFQCGASADVATYPQLIDLGEVDTDAPFMETAGALHGLDLLIACDSGPAHIAGALRACPVWILLNFFFDPRWCAVAETTPWYPKTHRLFQQDEPGAWEPLIELGKDELEEAIRFGTLR